jgi:hypothetical protein
MHLLLYKCNALVMALDVSLRSARVEVMDKNPDYKISLIEQFRVRATGFRKLLGFAGHLRSYRVSIDNNEKCMAGFHVDVISGEIAIAHAFGMHAWRYEFDPDDYEPVNITKTVAYVNTIPYAYPRPEHDVVARQQIIQRHDERKKSRKSLDLQDDVAS